MTMRPPMIEQLESRLLMAGVVSGDFTGDGVTDIVTTQGGLKLRVGNGNGTFKAGTLISSNGFARGGSVAAADFNNDGSLDLAVFGGTSTTAALRRASGTRVLSGGLFVLLNNGNGTFQRPVSVSSATINSGRIVGGAITVGDFNLDGNQDILVTNVSSLTTPTPVGTTGGSTGFAVGTSFGGITTGTNNGFFATTTTGFDSLLGTGTTNLLGGMSGNGGFIGTNGTFGTGITGGAAATPPPAGAVGPPAVPGAATAGSVAFILDGNGNGTFQAARRINLT